MYYIYIYIYVYMISLSIYIYIYIYIYKYGERDWWGLYIGESTLELSNSDEHDSILALLVNRSLKFPPQHMLSHQSSSHHYSKTCIYRTCAEDSVSTIQYYYYYYYYYYQSQMLLGWAFTVRAPARTEGPAGPQ